MPTVLVNVCLLCGSDELDFSQLLVVAFLGVATAVESFARRPSIGRIAPIATGSRVASLRAHRRRTCSLAKDHCRCRLIALGDADEVLETQLDLLEVLEALEDAVEDGHNRLCVFRPRLRELELMRLAAAKNRANLYFPN